MMGSVWMRLAPWSLVVVMSCAACAGCDDKKGTPPPKEEPPRLVDERKVPVTPPPVIPRAAPQVTGADKALDKPGEPGKPKIEGQAPQADRDLLATLSDLRATIAGGDMPGLLEGLAAGTLRMLGPAAKTGLSPQLVQQMGRMLDGEPTRIIYNGGRGVVEFGGGPLPRWAYFFLEGKTWKLDLSLRAPYKEPDKGEPDPLNKPISLAEATAGLTGKGQIKATIETSLGNIRCTLLEDFAPQTVAHWVGLARGLRAFKDTKLGKWVARPFFDGLIFHRVIPDFMIQGGDPLGVGTGGPGFSIADEFDTSAKMDKAGLLAMANSGPNTNGSQFFLTEKEAPWLTDRHTIFGLCDDIDVIKKIARVPKRSGGGDRPAEDVKIVKIGFARGS